MASLNLNWFFDNWFPKPPKPSKHHFACITSNSNLSFPQNPTNPPPTLPDLSSSSSSNKYTRMLEQFYWECDARPDHRHTPQVEQILSQPDPLTLPKPDPTPAEIEENKNWWDEFNSNPVVDFLRRANEIDNDIREAAIKKNKHPYRLEDRELWNKLPLVPGPDGKPMPRKSIVTRQEAHDKFWDFAKQHFFGLWGFRQRPYPPGRPIDAAQAIGYQNLERRYYDFVMKCGAWYYKDRLGRTRGPMVLQTMKTAWAGGFIDTNTFVWGEDMDEWAPIGMVYGLQKAVATWEVRLGAAATAFLHKLQKGIPPWSPLKGLEKKTYQQLQQEAIESKKRDMAVLEANGGIWPGVRTPSHALFLWASGSELTSILETDHMPNKFIPKELRYRLAKVIPGLRPWEVLSIEQAMDQITYGGEWYREPLGTFTTGPPYIERANEDLKEFVENIGSVVRDIARRLERLYPYLDVVEEKIEAERAARDAQQKERETALNVATAMGINGSSKRPRR